MAASSLLKTIQQRPISALISTFFLWKFAIFLLAALSPGRGYDTSTEYLLDYVLDEDNPNVAGLLSVQHVVYKLARWDAFYFISTAKRGHLYEQEWAFGWGFSKLVAGVSRATPHSLPESLRETFSAILIANTSHLLSVLILFFLCRSLYGPSSYTTSAFLPACLHIFAPAGIFLSAPYGESLFSFLNFTGYLCYARSFLVKSRVVDRRVQDDAAVISAGFIFGLACLVRSNGLFNGLIFAYDLALIIPQAPHLLINGAGIRYTVSVLIAGMLIAVGFATPQYLAHSEFCTHGTSQGGAREWCSKIPPSVYVYVQQKYWGVGFLRYWTISNMPLFVLAAPMLIIMTASAFWVFSAHTSPKHPRSNLYGMNSSYLARLALPQVVLVVLALTNFHVQVITRIASAYPLIYLWVAKCLEDGLTVNIFRRSFDGSRWIVRWMVVYALVQGGLFASYLPPA